MANAHDRKMVRNKEWVITLVRPPRDKEFTVLLWTPDAITAVTKVLEMYRGCEIVSLGQNY